VLGGYITAVRLDYIRIDTRNLEADLRQRTRKIVDKKTEYKKGRKKTRLQKKILSKDINFRSKKKK
jgi:hypothetical protein